MGTGLGIALISIVILGAGLLALLSMDASKERRDALGIEWETAAKRLGLVAQVSSAEGAPSLQAPTPDGRLRIDVRVYRTNLERLSNSHGVLSTWIEVDTECHTGLRISERSPLSRGARRLSGESSFDDVFVVEGPDDVLFACLSDSLRSRLLEIVRSGRKCYEIKLVGGRFSEVRSNAARTAAELRDLIREALSIARILNERSKMPIDDALLDNLKNDRSIVMKRGCLESISRSYPARLPEALEALSALGLDDLRDGDGGDLRTPSPRPDG